MTVYIVRFTIFVLLPLAVAAVIIRLDHAVTTRAQKLELYLIYFFGLGIAGGGIGAALGHLFLPDLVAQSVGWGTGSPFQLEMGFANLALGVLGLVAVSRRDGFREATTIAVTIVGVGATIVHLVDILQSGNLAPGNTFQNVANLARPALLIGLLRASREADRAAAPDLELPWAARHGPAVGMLTALVSTGFAVGYALDRLVPVTAIGIAAGVVAASAMLGHRRPAATQEQG